MRAKYILVRTLCLLLFGHTVNCYSQHERRNFLEDEINQGVRTTPQPTQLKLPHLLPSPASPLWSVLQERQSPEFEKLPEGKTRLAETDIDAVEDIGLYDDYKNSKESEMDIQDFTDMSTSDREKKTEGKRYFSSLGGAHIHSKREGPIDNRHFDLFGGSHVFKRALERLGSAQTNNYKRALDSLGGWTIHGYKRHFDTLGGATLHSDFKRFISSLGGGLVHGYKRNFDTLGGMNVHNGYKRFISSLGGGNIHSGFKRGLDTLGGANLQSGYKRYFSSLGGSNIHEYKRTLSTLGGANIHDGFKRQSKEYGGTDMFVPDKRLLDSLGGFNVHRYKRSRIGRLDNNKTAEKKQSSN